MDAARYYIAWGCMPKVNDLRTRRMQYLNVKKLNELEEATVSKRGMTRVDFGNNGMSSDDIIGGSSGMLSSVGPMLNASNPAGGSIRSRPSGDGKDGNGSSNVDGVADEEEDNVSVLTDRS